MRVVRRWDLRAPRGGTAVVIDVLRFSTTLCALLRAGREAVWVARTPEALGAARDAARSDVFSEIDFAWPGRRFDNSPALASAARGRGRAAYVTTTSGSLALWASRGARRVLVGGFANFHAVLARLRRAPSPLSFVPAAPPIRPGNIEDELCARAFIEALRGRSDAPARALSRFQRSPRRAEFLRLPIATAVKDLACCTGLDGLPVVPEAVFGAGAPFARIRRAA